VTRAQLATFFARGFELRATGADYFDDDERSVHDARSSRGVLSNGR
jgi:hypothetical protein